MMTSFSYKCHILSLALVSHFTLTVTFRMKYPHSVWNLFNICKQMISMSKHRVMTKSKSRQRRATSNIFAMLDQTQIHEFKEAFNIIDQNRDGYIDSEDLREMLGSLG